MIDHKNKCIFIHLAKTGGTSIEKCLVQKDWWHVNRKTKHLSAKSASIIYKDYWNEYYKFSFVRNPWSLMPSWYRFRRVKENQGMDFKSFLLYYDFSSKTAAGEKSWLPDTLSQFELLIENGQPLVDFVGKFENLQENFNTVCDKIKVPHQKLLHVHKTNKKSKHYTEYYNEETKQIVAEKYAKDIEYFGYEFGE